MTTRGIHDKIRGSRIIKPQTITTSAINSGDVDLRGFDSAMILVDIGDIDGLGTGSPTPGTIAVKVEHADDDGAGAAGAYENVADTDLDGDTQSAGVVHTFADGTESEYLVGYIGSRRFIKVTLTPSSLGAGGPIGAWLIQDHAHLSPVTQG